MSQTQNALGSVIGLSHLALPPSPLSLPRQESPSQGRACFSNTNQCTPCSPNLLLLRGFTLQATMRLL